MHELSVMIRTESLHTDLKAWQIELELAQWIKVLNNIAKNNT